MENKRKIEKLLVLRLNFSFLWKNKGNNNNNYADDNDNDCSSRYVYRMSQKVSDDNTNEQISLLYLL